MVTDFILKAQTVIDLWKSVLPVGDRKMLIRDRKSHILWGKKLVTYPIELNAQTMQTLGLKEGLRVAISYLCSKYKCRDINSLEDFYIDHFGQELYDIFFRDYTQKLWGLPANEISPDWGVQRIRTVSLGKVLRSFFQRKNGKQSVDRSFITQFYYPAFGSGQLWDALAERIKGMGGQFECDCSVGHLEVSNTHISSLVYCSHGQSHKREFDYVISSMPLNELIFSIEDVPTEVTQIGRELRYRDMIIIAIDIPQNFMEKSSIMFKETIGCICRMLP